MDFTGKIVLITGGAGGIGKEAAKIFYKEGANIALVVISQEALNKAAEELNFQQERYITIVADVSNEDQVRNYVQKTVETFGKIDVFFNNAGIEGKVAPIVNQTDDDLMRVLNINVKDIFFGLKHVIPVMTKQKSGAIVNTSSVAGLKGSPGLSPYIASKHAVIGLTKAAAVECGELGIRVNAVCPAPINTRMMRSIEEGTAPGHAEQAKQQYSEAIPLKRYGEASQVAQLVAFLAADKAAYITGASYPVDGGMNAI